MWASTQYNSSNAWYVTSNGLTNDNYRTDNYFVAPVLEIPNANA